MAGSDDARAWADRLLGGDVLATAIQQELDRVVPQRPEAERHAQLVAIYEAIAAAAGERAVSAATDARQAGASWRVLAEAVDRSVSAVRHRYDPSTIDSRRQADRRRRGA